MDDYFDLVFVGNVVRTTMHRADGTTEPLVGGPVVQAALATSWSDRRVAVATRMAPEDADLVDPLKKAGIPVYASAVSETTRGDIYYLSDNPDDRRHSIETSAGPFSLADLGDIRTRMLHLAGVNRLEFPLQFMLDLGSCGLPFSIDMQALIRAAYLETGEVVYSDYPHKKEVAAMAAKTKLDKVEAQLLTGTDDLEQAAIQFEQWGSPEVMVTSAEGALVRHNGETYFERFTNRNAKGRTGRGDTVFAAYLVRRLDYGVADSLRFAAALCSIKMETPGPFAGTLDDVLARVGAGQKS